MEPWIILKCIFVVEKRVIPYFSKPSIRSVFSITIFIFYKRNPDIARIPFINHPIFQSADIPSNSRTYDRALALHSSPKSVFPLFLILIHLWFQFIDNRVLPFLLRSIQLWIQWSWWAGTSQCSPTYESWSMDDTYFPTRRVF